MRNHPRASRIVSLVGSAAMTVALLAACHAGPAPSPTIPPTRPTPSPTVSTYLDYEVRGQGTRQQVALTAALAITDVVAAATGLGLTVLRTAEAGDNIVAAPASAQVGLAMLAEGAAGETASQFDAALGASGQARTDTMNALLAAMSDYDDDLSSVRTGQLPTTPLAHIATQIALDDEITARPGYLNALVAGYDAGVTSVDLQSAAGQRTLNEWTNAHSGGLVPSSPVTLTDDALLTVQNAMVFAAQWDSPFPEDGTKHGDFTLMDGTVVGAEMMHQSRPDVYAASEGWQSVRLPYQEGFHADVILPPAGVDPAAISPETWRELQDQLNTSTDDAAMDVDLPTLDIADAAVDLRPALTALGLNNLFDQPDLSGISDSPLHLDGAMQTTVLQVSEKGTVAAAVTHYEGGVGAAPSKPADFRVDHPYLFTVSHTATSWPLFMAAIRDPRH